MVSRLTRLSRLFRKEPISQWFAADRYDFTTALSSLSFGSTIHTSAPLYDARVPNPQKRLERPSLVGPKQLDRLGNPIWRLKRDNAMNRCDSELLEPIPRYDVRNRIVYPPIEDLKAHYEDLEEPCPRIQPRHMYHTRRQIKGRPNDVRYAALLIEGMQVDEACEQLDFHPKNFAEEVKETLLEAVDKAVHEHGFEFRSNMYVGLARVKRGVHFRGVRKHARGKMGQVTYYYSNLAIMLVEGERPQDFKPYDPTDTRLKMEERLKELRSRKIHWDLKWIRPDVTHKRF